MSDIRKIAVLTSGGDAPGMNSAVRAVVVSAINSGIEIRGTYRLGDTAARPGGRQEHKQSGWNDTFHQ